MSILTLVIASQRRRVYGRIIVLGLYALVAMVTPLLHHDVACHLQSKSHCDACTASAAASRIESAITLFGHVGPAEPAVPGRIEVLVSADRPASPGRAPPTDSTSA